MRVGTPQAADLQVLKLEERKEESLQGRLCFSDKTTVKKKRSSF